MITKTVTVAYVNQPKAGKKQGNIKTKDGDYIGVWPKDLDRFEAGKTYTIECETRDHEGKTFTTFVDFAKGQPADTPPAAGHNSKNGNGEAKAEEMFVMGVVGRAMGSGNFGVTDIAMLTKAATQAWRERHGDEAPY